MWFRLLRKCSTFPRCVYMRAFYSVPLVLGAFELPPQPGDLPFEFAVLRRQRSAPPQGRRDAAEEVRPLPRSRLLHEGDAAEALQARRRRRLRGRLPSENQIAG